MTKTLAQMTEKEREACIGMWVNTPLGYGVLLSHLSPWGYHEPVVIIPSRCAVHDGRWDWDKLDLLPHLPRAWNSDGTSPINMPATPEEMQDAFERAVNRWETALESMKEHE